MKIVYLITGSGGSFYCGNCYRDMLFVRAIRKVPGIEARAVPLYLPPDNTNVESGFDKKVFFGAISMYLREKVGFLKNMPSFLYKFFDSHLFLSLAAKKAGTTRTEGLEELTLNMIEGGNAFRKKEVDRLVDYITREGKPDVIHLSNALILGLARHLKNRIDVKIVCSLLNEDDWIEEMAEPYKSRAWEMIARESEYIDSFITPSKYYRDLFLNKTKLINKNISIVPLGFDPEINPPSKSKENTPALGFFSRLNFNNGLDKIVDAFIKLKMEDRIPGLKLIICGGFTGDDKPFISAQLKKVRESGFADNLNIYNEFHGEKKIRFFNDVDLVSVPVNKYDGYGLYILEANCAGVPVLQPATGGFPEILETTGGGVIYSPDTTDSLADNIFRMFSDREQLIKYGEKGKEMVRARLSLSKMADGLSAVYNKTLNHA